MRKKRILVIEDDAGIREGIVDALDYSGFETIEASRGDTGLEKALLLDFDLLLLDLVLPGCSGMDILREVRKSQTAIPVIILSARGDEDDRVQGLRLGADDYVVKPFSVKELLARVDAVLRRSPERSSYLQKINLPGARVDYERRTVTSDTGESVELSERELHLLHYLASNAGRTIHREEILSRVWRIEPGAVETRTIDMHVARLREKLRVGGVSSEVLVTVRGRGYLFREDGGVECDRESSG